MIFSMVILVILVIGCALLVAQIGLRFPTIFRNIGLVLVVLAVVSIFLDLVDA